MASFWRNIPVSIAAVLVALAALCLYAATMAPSLTLGHSSTSGAELTYNGTDGAELAVAVHTLGIPHPSGYPTYVLLAQAFRVLPWGNLAGRLSFFSAVAAALTAGAIALAAAALFPAEEDRLPALVAALTAGLTLAVAGLFWSQALIAEVYTLHTLFVALACWLLLRWRQRGGGSLLLVGLTLGLGLGNHVGLSFLLPGALLFLLLSRRPLRRDETLAALGLLLIGLAVYLYLPLRAAADPWLNWGDPRDWPGFWAHVSGQAYQGYLFQVPLLQAAQNVAATAGFLLRDFAPWGILLGLGGLIVLGQKDRPALTLTVLPAGLGLLLAITYGGANSQVHLLPLYLAWALWAGVAAATVTAALSRRFGGKGAAVAFVLPLLSLVLVAWYGPTWSLHSDPGPIPQQTTLLAALPDGGLLLTDKDEETFPLWYVQTVEGTRPDLAVVDVRLLEWPWYRRQLPSRYPDLTVPTEPSDDGWLSALLAANAGRPIYSVGSLSLPAGYRLRYEGPVYLVVPP